MSVDSEHGEAVDDEEDRIESLQQQKAKDKTAFTNKKNNLLSLLDEENYPSRREVKGACQMLCEVQERTMSTMEELSREYLRSKEKEKRKKLTYEMDRLEAEFRRLMTRLKNIWTIGRVIIEFGNRRVRKYSPTSNRRQSCTKKYNTIQ